MGVFFFFFFYKAMSKLQNSTVCNYMTERVSIGKFRLFLDALPLGAKSVSVVL